MIHSRRKILMLTPFVPAQQADHGGSRASARLLTNLAGPHRLCLVYLRGPDEAPLDAGLRDACERAAEVPLPPRGALARRVLQAAFVCRGVPTWVSHTRSPEFGAAVEKSLREWRPDIVQAEYHVLGQYLPLVAESGAPCILTEYEPGVTAARDRLRYCPLWQKLPAAANWLAWRQYERSLLRIADAVVVLTERDEQALRRLAPSASIRRIPLTVVPPDRTLDPVGEPALLFIGNFMHPPNIDAALRLITRIFPAVRSRMPGALLWIVGGNVPAALKRASGPGVVVTGFVPDITPWLDRAGVVVAPLRYGGGMRVKVLEAMAAGKAVLASSLAAEGLNIRSGDQAELADSDEEMQAAALGLLAQPERRRRLAERAQNWIRDNFSPARTAAEYESLYSTLLDRGVTGRAARA